ALTHTCSPPTTTLFPYTTLFRSVIGLEHAGLPRGLVRGVGEDVPAAEDEAVKFFERDELPDHRRAALGALPQADGGELGHRADWQRQALADELHPGHKRRADRPHAGRENTQRALRQGNGGGPTHPTTRFLVLSRKHVSVPPPSCDPSHARSYS